MAMEDIEELRKKLKEHEERISALEGIVQSKPETAQTGAEKPLSLKEFLLPKKPQNDVHRTLGIGYYLEKYASMPLFNVNDLEKGFRDAKEKVPKNVSDKVQMNAKNGHMMPAGEKKDGKKAWVLTNSGEKYVENNFQKET